MQLIDSHAHLLSSRYDEDRDALMAELAQVMEAVVECASEPGDFPRVVQLAEQYPFIYGAVGVHPEAIDQWTADIPAQLAAYLNLPKIVALGEVGLDYYWEPDKKQAQKAALEAQIAVAKAAGKPVILHNREATADLYDLLQANRICKEATAHMDKAAQLYQEADDLMPIMRKKKTKKQKKFVNRLPILYTVKKLFLSNYLLNYSPCFIYPCFYPLPYSLSLPSCFIVSPFYSISYFSTAIDYTRNRASSEFIRNSGSMYCLCSFFNLVNCGLIFRSCCFSAFD